MQFAFFDAHEAEKNRGVHGGKQRVHFEAQLIRQVMEIDAPTLIGEDFQQPVDVAAHGGGQESRGDRSLLLPIHL